MDRSMIRLPLVQAPLNRAALLIMRSLSRRYDLSGTCQGLCALLGRPWPILAGWGYLVVF